MRNNRSFRVIPDKTLKPNEIVIPVWMTNDTELMDAINTDAEILVTDDSGIRLPQCAYNRMIQRSRDWTFDFS